MLHSPGFYFLFRIVQGQEPIRVQTFIPKMPVKTLSDRGATFRQLQKLHNVLFEKRFRLMRSLLSVKSRSCLIAKPLIIEMDWFYNTWSTICAVRLNVQHHSL